MTKRIHHYRPQRTSPESLEAIFVAREHLLQEILERLERWQPGGSRQHYLLVGPRGIGKTHVLSLINYRISKTPPLDKKWFPLLFPEESYGITKIADLLLEALRILVDKTGDKEAAAVYKQVKHDDNDARVTDLTLDVFRKYHRDTGTGFLFLIENLNRLLERQIKAKSEVHLLRKILIEEEWLVTVCTSPTYLDAVIKEDEPFFEFFQVRFLAELSQKDQLAMFIKLADYEGNRDFQAYLQKYRSRLQALYHFTGGNPRLTVMLYDLVSYRAITEVQDELDRLLDKITPFYQDRMKDIGEQEGKLIETMALLDEGCTPMELAVEARMEANTVRTVLGRLEKAGYVRRETRGQKKTVYIIPERLFRIWHQMNRSREGRGLIRYLLEFFSTWYQTKEERDEVWNDIIKKMQMGADASAVRGSAATALGKIGSEKAVEPLIDALSDEANNVRNSASIALIHIAAEGAISHLDKVIDTIFEHLNNVEEEYLPSITRKLFRAAFRSADLKIISSALESAKKFLDLDAFFYLPYEIAFDYIKSNNNPIILDRQHPEMRDAVQLLINLYQQGPAQPGIDNTSATDH